MSKLSQYKQLAASPDTLPELLRELAAKSSKAVCERITANPNTPTDILFKLGAKFPKQLLENPILPLLLLENPNFIEEIPLNTLIRLIKEEEVPNYILNAASKLDNEDVLILVASHLKVSKTVLFNLVKSRYEKVKEVAKLHVNISENIQLDKEEIVRQVILNFNSNCVYEVNQQDLAIAQLIPEFLLPALHISTIRTIALHPNTSIHTLKVLCGNSFDALIHQFVALSPNIPATLLECLSEDYNQIYLEALQKSNSCDKFYAEQVLAAIAGNRNTPIYLIEKLYHHVSDLVYTNIAGNPNTPAELLDLLSNEQNVYVRFNVGKNPSTSISTLEKLYLEQLNPVRFSISGNIKAPANLLQILAKDKDSNIRNQVAIHPNTPKRALELLAQDEHESIRCSVAKNPNITVKLLSILAKDKSDYIRNSVAQNCKTPVNLLKILAQDEHPLVRQAVASNPNTPLYLLKELALCRYSNVHLALAANPNTPKHLVKEQLIQEKPEKLAQNSATPASILISLANNPDHTVRTLLAANQNTPQEALDILARDKKDYVRHRAANNPKMSKENLAKITLERIAKTQVPSFSRFIVFLHHQAPQQALAKNYRSEVWLERYAIAQNPNTPKHIISELTLDANQIVRAAAQVTINT
jgi:hypothetical protein